MSKISLHIGHETRDYETTRRETTRRETFGLSRVPKSRVPRQNKILEILKCEALDEVKS